MIASLLLLAIFLSPYVLYLFVIRPKGRDEFPVDPVDNEWFGGDLHTIRNLPEFDPGPAYMR